MYSYETQIGGALVALTLHPGGLIAGTVAPPGGEVVTVELACPYKPDAMGPHWIDFAYAAAGLALTEAGNRTDAALEAIEASRTATEAATITDPTGANQQQPTAAIVSKAQDGE